MNGVPDYYEIKLKQTSKGVWYCDGVVAFDEDVHVVAEKAEVLMTNTEKILKKHNKEAE